MFFVGLITNALVAEIPLAPFLDAQPVLLVAKDGIRLSYFKEAEGVAAVRSVDQVVPTESKEALYDAFKKHESTSIVCSHSKEHNPFVVQMTFDVIDDALSAKPFTDIRIYGAWDGMPPRHVVDMVTSVCMPKNTTPSILGKAAAVTLVGGSVAAALAVARSRASGSGFLSGGVTPVDDTALAPETGPADLLASFWGEGAMEPKTIAGRLAKALTNPNQLLSHCKVVAFEQLEAIGGFDVEGIVRELINSEPNIVFILTEQDFLKNSIDQILRSLVMFNNNSSNAWLWIVNDEEQPEADDEAYQIVDGKNAWVHRLGAGTTENDIKELARFKTPQEALDEVSGSGFYRFWDKKFHFSQVPQAS